MDVVKEDMQRVYVTEEDARGEMEANDPLGETWKEQVEEEEDFQAL